MPDDIQVIARFTPSEHKQLETAKRETGMTQKAILSRSFAEWNASRLRDKKRKSRAAE